MRLQHPFEPLCSSSCEILILGSFPSAASREGSFYYDHPRNRFWKILSCVFDRELPQSHEEKRQFLLSCRTAVWDVVKSCEITASGDSTIRNAEVNDLTEILSSSRISRIFANGSAAYRIYQAQCSEKYGISAVKLPSSSPANASKSTDELCREWREKICGTAAGTQ